MILTLLIAQIMMILRNESMKIKRKFRRDKAAGCLRNYAANNPRTRANALGLGLTPSDSDCLYR